MRYSYDPDKRAKVLEERGLDLADAKQLFEGFYLTRADKKHSNEEERNTTLGIIGGDVVIVCWTPRTTGERRIITMWKANGKERATYHRQRDRYG